MTSRPSLRASCSTDVTVYVYDVTKGLCSVVSPLLFGARITSIYHTSVVVHNQEYFFSSKGIVKCDPGSSILESPDTVINYGKYRISRLSVADWVANARISSFTPDKYSLLDYNCVTFTDTFLYFLIRASLPDKIKYQVNSISATPLGSIWIKFLQSKDW